jgi:hypothetical protein
MARRVFFSFHHQDDSWRAGVVRGSWLTQDEENTVLDAAAWEEIQKPGDVAIWKWINGELDRTSVTVVLIGEYTAKRRWVRYELQSSLARGNGVVGIYVHGIKNQKGETSNRGHNPLDDVTVRVRDDFFGIPYEEERCLSSIFATYLWSDDNGQSNLASWIEEAVEKAEKLALIRVS